MNRITACLCSLLGAALVFLGLGALGCASHRSRDAAKHIDDTALTVKVKSALLADKEVGRLALTVKSRKGTVELTGIAPSDWQRVRARILAEEVPGVKAVQDKIQVKVPNLPQWGSPKQ